MTPFTPPTPQETSRSGLRILLAEDHIINQKVALLMLQRQGFQADLAENGQEVLDCVRARRYDVVLLDMQMPVMDGIEAARHLNEDPACQPRPYIIALTANAMQGTREECLAAGMDDYLSKPMDQQTLRKVLDEVALKLGIAPSEAPPPPPLPSYPVQRFGHAVS